MAGCVGKRAFERAQARANAYAALLGYDGAKVLAIAESIEGSGSIAELAPRGLSIAKADAAPVQPGMVSTGISITIKYELVKQTDLAAE